MPNFSPDGSSPSFLRLARLRCFRFRRLQDDGLFAPQRTDEHARWVEMKSTYGNKILKKMWLSINHHQYWNIKFPVAWLYANGQLSGVIRTLEYHNYPQRLIGSASFRQTCGCPSHILGRKPCWTSVSDMLLICGFQPCWTCSSLGVITTNLLEAHNSTLDTYTNHILIGYVRIFCGWYDYLQYWWLNSHQRVMSDDRQNWRHNVPHTHLHFPPVS